MYSILFFQIGSEEIANCSHLYHNYPVCMRTHRVKCVSLLVYLSEVAGRSKGKEIEGAVGFIFISSKLNEVDELMHAYMKNVSQLFLTDATLEERSVRETTFQRETWLPSNMRS